jgi:hypothetical protein
MANEVSLFQQAVPDYAKEVQLDDMTKALGGSGGLKRISIRGKRFRLVVNGEEITKSNADAMNIVVVNGTRYVSRKYYAGAYVPGEAAPPDCWSNDGEKPDASIETPKHSNCQDCPMNIKGSGQGESRACRFEKRLAVVLADDIGGSVYQLLLPSKSYFGKSDNTNAMPFEQYAKYVASQGYNINMIVTEMKMDEDSDQPQLTFRATGFLTREQWETAKNQGNTSEAKQAVVMAAYQTDKPKQRLAAPAPKAEPAPETEEPKAEVPEPTKRAKKAASEPTPKADLASIMGEWATDD